jgi:hypothetical protein
MRYVLSALLLLTPLFQQEARSDRPDLTIISPIKTEVFDIGHLRPMIDDEDNAQKTARRHHERADIL